VQVVKRIMTAAPDCVGHGRLGGDLTDKRPSCSLHH